MSRAATTANCGSVPAYRRRPSIGGAGTSSPSGDRTGADASSPSGLKSKNRHKRGTEAIKEALILLVIPESQSDIRDPVSLPFICSRKTLDFRFRGNDDKRG